MKFFTRKLWITFISWDFVCIGITNMMYFSLDIIFCESLINNLDLNIEIIDEIINLVSTLSVYIKKVFAFCKSFK